MDRNILENVYHRIATICNFETSPKDSEGLSELYFVARNNLIQRPILSLECASAIIDRAWERMNQGIWTEVSKDIRDWYAYGCFVKIEAILKKELEENTKKYEDVLRRALRVCDMGLLLAGVYVDELKEIADILCDFIHEDYYGNIQTFDQLPTTDVPNIVGAKREPVLVEQQPGLEKIFNKYLRKGVPVKIIEYASYWPALTKWNNIGYMCKILGPRLLPIEIGESYDKEQWSQRIMHGSEFITKYVLNQSADLGKKGYLAQHQIFNQIPCLLKDLSIPEYCYMTDDTSVDLNIWFGPCGTVSPLHYDAKHNFLTQIVGKKRVILFDPKWTSCLYPHESELLYNTARVDPTNWNPGQFPEFAKTKSLECILNAGEMLYIPSRWWHHVTSLSTSISVSFWWNTTEAQKET